MKIHREGIPSILVTLLFTAALNLSLYFFTPEMLWLRWAACLLSAFLLVMMLQFFRNPSRQIVTDDNHVLSPADGKVVVIEEVTENEFFRDRRIQVSVFMSPLNVHVNRNPVGGTVSYVKYHPGAYLVAWHPKSSTDNERTTLVIETPQKQQVLFRQIAGAMARRIVYYLKEGQQVRQGEEMGFIKFGSRVDVFLPLSARVHVQLGQTVKGGQTVIASFS